MTTLEAVILVGIIAYFCLSVAIFIIVKKLEDTNERLKCLRDQKDDDIKYASDRIDRALEGLSDKIKLLNGVPTIVLKEYLRTGLTDSLYSDFEYTVYERVKEGFNDFGFYVRNAQSISETEFNVLKKGLPVQKDEEK